jgi:hypothetical protein
MPGTSTAPSPRRVGRSSTPLAGPEPDEAGPPAAPPRGPHRRKRRGARPHRDPRHRQAVARDARSAGRAAGVLLRLRRVGREESGFPPRAVNVVTGFGRRRARPCRPPPAREDLLHGQYRHRLALAANIASRFLGSILELEGKSPNIVFGDADLHNAAMGVIAGVAAAAGQTGVAGSRVYARRSVYDELLERRSRSGEHDSHRRPARRRDRARAPGLRRPARQGRRLHRCGS